MDPGFCQYTGDYKSHWSSSSALSEQSFGMQPWHATPKPPGHKPIYPRPALSIATNHSDNTEWVALGTVLGFQMHQAFLQQLCQGPA